MKKQHVHNRDEASFTEICKALYAAPRGWEKRAWSVCEHPEFCYLFNADDQRRQWILLAASDRAVCQSIDQVITQSAAHCLSWFIKSAVFIVRPGQGLIRVRLHWTLDAEHHGCTSCPSPSFECRKNHHHHPWLHTLCSESLSSLKEVEDY